MQKNYQTFLLTLARRSLKHFLDTQNYLKVSPGDLPSQDLLKKQGTFVTLTINSQLRGCIGHIEPVNPIYKDIVENAVSAGFYDPRFFPLTQEEFSQIKIEISLLSVPEKLDYKTSTDLLEKLSKEKPGIIIQKGLNKATFLPQVWEELTRPEDFLSQLCQKAGLSESEWRRGELNIKIYTAEVFSEKN